MYCSEILIVTLFFFHAPMATILPVSSWAMLCFYFKILAFTRGYDHWGPLVRMIGKILIDLRYFLVVLLILVMGFAMSFIAMGDGVARSSWRRAAPISSLSLSRGCSNPAARPCAMRSG